MPHWLSITLAVACWLFALAQVRITLVYMGIIDSPTVGSFQDVPTPNKLSAISIRSAITFTIFGFLFVFVAWPKLLTYFAAVWTIRAFIDAVLLCFGRGIHAIQGDAFAQVQRASVLPAFAKVIGSGLWLAGFAYFFGF